jgi:outer membrane lipase/esterase
MKFQSQRLGLLSFSMVAAAALLAACGGDDDTPAGPRTSAVKVVGDSLNDVGTFGVKATVQGTAAQPAKLWVDVVAAGVGINNLCARYTATAAGPVLNTAAAAATCTNYAIGGGVVNRPGTGTADASPLSVVQQLKDLSASGPFVADDLLLVDGGGNDAAEVFGRYLAAAADGGAAYVALMSELLTPAQVQAIATGGQAGLAAAGGQYMTALANALADAVTTQALDKGAKRVVVITVPNITKTPRFLNVLSAVAVQSGGGTVGAQAAEQVAGVANSWVQAYNAQLKARLGSLATVAVVDFYAQLNGWVANPASGGFTNVTNPACPAVGTDASGLPTYSLPTCTEAALSATPPSGSTADWWRTYLFSDNFHGTPRANQLIGEGVLAAITSKGWK